MIFQSKQQILIKKQDETPDKDLQPKVGRQQVIVSTDTEKIERLDKRGELKDTLQFVTIESVDEEHTEDTQKLQPTTPTKV